MPIQKGFSRVRERKALTEQIQRTEKEIAEKLDKLPDVLKEDGYPMCRRTWQPTVRRRLLWSSSIRDLAAWEQQVREKQKPAKKEQAKPPERESVLRNACVSFRRRVSRETSRDRERNPLTETADRHEKPPLWYHPCGGIHKNLICVLQA